MELRFTYAAEEHRHILYSLIKIRMVNCLNQSFTKVLLILSHVISNWPVNNLDCVNESLKCVYNILNF